MEMPVLRRRSHPSFGVSQIADIFCQYKRKYERSREDHQVEKCQTNPRGAEFFLQQTSAANCGGTNNSTYTVVADRVTIAFLGSPFPYPQISSVRFSCS